MLRRFSTIVPKPPVSAIAGQHISIRGLDAAHRMSVVEVQPGVKGVVTNVRSKPFQDDWCDVWVTAKATPSSTGKLGAAAPSLAPDIHIPIGKDVLGRVLSPFGVPMDGKGDIPGENAPLRTSLCTPGVTQRQPPSSVWPSGYKAIDAFYPLKRGQFTAIGGEAGLGKGDLARDLFVTSLKSTLDAVGVLCLIGRSRKAITSTVAHIAAAGLADRVVVIASTEEDPVAVQFLTPFSAGVIGGYFRDTGRHVLVLYDRLSSHFDIARQLSGDLGNASHTAQHEALIDSCANMSPVHGGGSLTAIGVLDIAPAGAKSSAADRVRNAASWNLCSLADNRLVLSSQQARRGALLPLDMEDVSARTGHVSQGAALCYYANACKMLLAQLRETASNASAAQAYGILPEADQDAALDAYCKLNMLLFPTKSALDKAKYVKTAADSAMMGLSLFAGGALEADLPSTSGTLPSKKAMFMGIHEAAPVPTLTTPPPTPPPAATPSDATKPSDKEAKLLSKMTPEQLQTLQAVRAGRTGRAPSVSAKYVGVIGKSSHVQPSAQEKPFTVSLESTSVGASSASAATTVDASISPSSVNAHRCASAEALFATLFAVAHGYTRDVPLCDVYRYEAELLDVLQALPAPPAEGEGSSSVHASLLSAALAATPTRPLFGMPTPQYHGGGGEDSSSTGEYSDRVWGAMHAAVAAFTAEFLL